MDNPFELCNAEADDLRAAKDIAHRLLIKERQNTMRQLAEAADRVLDGRFSESEARQARTAALRAAKEPA